MNYTPSKLLTEIRAVLELDRQAEQEITSFENDGSKWRREKQDIIRTRSLTDERAIRLVGVLDTKLSMLPYAIERAKAVRPNIVATVDRRAGEVIDAALAILHRVEAEAFETMRSTVGLYISDEEEADTEAQRLFAKSEIGKRLAIVGGSRIYPPIRDIGNVNTLINYLAEAEELGAQWEQKKFDFGKVPAAQFGTVA